MKQSRKTETKYVKNMEELGGIPEGAVYISPKTLYGGVGATEISENQKKFARLAKEKKYVLNKGGYRSGKSIAACVQGIMAAVKHPGSFGGIFREIEASIEDSIMRTWFKMCPPEIIEHYNSTKKHLYLINGSEVIFRGFDKVAYLSKLRSVELDWFIVCQAEEISYDHFLQLKSRLNGTNGPLKGWLEANPGGHDWLWEAFIDDPNDNCGFVRSSTMDLRGYLPEDYIQDLLAVDDEEWKRRYIYGEDVVFEGRVYKSFDRELHTVEHSEMPLERVRKWVLCKDWGWTNFGVSLLCGVTADEQWLVVKEVYRKETQVSSEDPSEETWLKIDKEIVDDYKVDEGWADPSRPDYIASYGKEGLPMEAGGNSIDEGIKRIRGLLAKRENGEPGMLVSKECVNFIGEVEGSKYKTIRGESTEKPVKKNDHGLDALKAALLSEEENEEDEGWESEWEEAPRGRATKLRVRS